MGLYPFQDGNKDRLHRRRADKWIKPPKMESMRRFVGPLAHYTLRYSRNVGKSRFGYMNATGEVVYEYAV